MGFFKRKTNAPLSTSMYQGDNATPARSPPRRGGLPLTADPVLDTPIAATATEAATAGTKSTGGTAATKKKKKIPKGFFKRRNNNQSQVTITPDKNEDGSSIDAGYTPQTRSQRGTTTASSTTPSMSFRVASSSFQGTPPPTRSRGNANNHRDDAPALVTPGKYDDSPRSSHDEIKRNLNLAFHESDDDKDEDEDEDGVDTRRGIPDNATTADDNRIHINDDDNDVAAEENKKFLQRIRASWKKSPGKRRQKQDLIRLIQENNNRTTSSNEGTDPSPLPAVPETIDHSDELSIPSLITEPEEIQKMIAASPERTAAAMSTVEESLVSAPRTATYSARAPGPSGHVVAPSSEKFPSGPFPRRALTLGERFLSLLQCGEDTTSDGYFGRIKCSDLCSPGNGAKNGLRAQRTDEDDRFVIPFIHELSKRGIKLIYHQAPADASSDWTQVTVKLFLRPGQCHEKEIHPPSLSWATLHVASRKVLTGSYDNPYESGEDTLWTHLNLWDVYSVMGAEDDVTVAGEEDGLTSPGRSNATMSTAHSEFDSRDSRTRANTIETTSYTRYTFDDDDNYEDRTVPSSGFFSITAGSSGDVYVFEAPSGSRRDYIVTGLKKMIGRASRHLIMGRLDVCAELYGEDAAPMSGELPSLVTPSQALSRVTHAFLDEL